MGRPPCPQKIIYQTEVAHCIGYLHEACNISTFNEVDITVFFLTVLNSCIENILHDSFKMNDLFIASTAMLKIAPDNSPSGRSLAGSDSPHARASHPNTWQIHYAG